MQIKKVLIIVAAVCMLITAAAPSVRAQDGVPYKTYTYDANNRRIITQTAYIPSRIIDGYESDTEESNTTLSGPEDMCLYEGRLYVADTGNSRIAVYDTDGTLIQSLGDGELKKPTGVFVNSFGVYVADIDAACVKLFSHDGRLLETYTDPKSPLMGNTKFTPSKVTVNSSGMMYIVSPGSVNGLIQIDASGKFVGFFGGNKSSAPLLRKLQRMLFTDEQLSKLSRIIPPSPFNAAIDSDGLIYTITQGTGRGAVKRFNIAGSDLFGGVSGFYQSLSDIAVDSNGNIFVVDSYKAKIIQYTQNGYIVFDFGGSDTGMQKMGLFRSPSGVAVDDSSNLYVLDKERANIQVLVPTEFALLVNKANALYQDGLYLESYELWQEVLQHNSMFDLAYQGIGMAEFKRLNFTAALEAFELAGDRQGYSDAFWEIRRVWLTDNIAGIIIGLALLLVIFKLIGILERKYLFFQPVRDWCRGMRNIKFIDDLMLPFRFMIHPVDTCYDIRQTHRGSAAAAAVWLFIYTALTIFSMYKTGFVFNGRDIREINPGMSVLTLVIPVIMFVVCNYLVSTISDGEGRLSEVFIASVSSLMPVIVFALPLVFLSNILTRLEAVIYSFFYIFSLLWSGLLLFIGIKTIHDFEIGTTVKNILLTVLLSLCTAALFSIVFGLTNQLTDFIGSLYQEVILRASSF